VAKSLKLAALYPNHLDLNGDHGNLLVLQKRLAWRGVASEIVAVTKAANLEDFDFLLLGHGSKDAWSDVMRIDPELILNVGKFARSGKPVLAISSGYEHLFEELETTEVGHGEHVSDFRESNEVVGYVNSSAVLPELVILGQIVMTLFHGPVLAKNPELADRIIANAGWCDVSSSNPQLRAVDELAKVSRREAFED
jgi:CobQ-like glutamine amidotransferase family enzyme